ncbi:antitoxin Xre/MbcA/ParS toxin-binding domain-containing protein [Thiohalocapsa sp. ML1]|jgi:putative toxin-antitoxin system antitoxin component (TIGR02293 family)|uniref:type II RES/Xre toxin-antitoxin system antitoxin n=1 Tax=Thiohalocapsa sp. ML1 TaxID=1431688 RepID=UPI00073243D7|nr:antitoxin Xre/MbcA/ParS toxin-binding domain-containing protein [Thiohalocapsa sp. ML1]
MHIAELACPAYEANRTTDDLLGGAAVLARVPRSELEWVDLIRRGLPAPALDALARNAGLAKADIAAAVGIPERTLARRKQEGRLHAEESSRLVRLARVIARAEQVFEEPAAAIDWLKSANAALGGATPLSLLDTDIGAEGVMDTLGRIEHGVFA